MLSASLKPTDDTPEDLVDSLTPLGANQSNQTANATTQAEMEAARRERKASRAATLVNVMHEMMDTIGKDTLMGETFSLSSSNLAGVCIAHGRVRRRPIGRGAPI